MRAGHPAGHFPSGKRCRSGSRWDRTARAAAMCRRDGPREPRSGGAARVVLRRESLAPATAGAAAGPGGPVRDRSSHRPRAGRWPRETCRILKTRPEKILCQQLPGSPRNCKVRCKFSGLVQRAGTCLLTGNSLVCSAFRVGSSSSKAKKSRIAYRISLLFMIYSTPENATEVPSCLK